MPGEYGAVRVLEHDAFLELLGAAVRRGAIFSAGAMGRVHRLDGRGRRRDQPGQQAQPVHVGLLTVVDAGAFQHVEDVEGVAHGLAIEQAVAWQAHGFTGDGFRDGDDQPFAVDAFDGAAPLAEHQAFAIVLFLRAVERIEQQMAERVVSSTGSSNCG